MLHPDENLQGLCTAQRRVQTLAAEVRGDPPAPASPASPCTPLGTLVLVTSVLHGSYQRSLPSSLSSFAIFFWVLFHYGWEYATQT